MLSIAAPGPGVTTSNVLIELYGTLNGNGTVAGFPSGGIGSNGHGPNANIYVRGNNLGLITNFKNWPINLTCCTNAEVNGVTIDNAGQASGAGSCEFNGHTTNIAFNSVTGGTYTDPVCTITTAQPHGLTTSSVFALTGAGGFPAGLGHFPQFVPTAVTSNTITFNAGAGLSGLTFNGAQVHALSGTYDPPTGNTTITTAQPHGLVPGSTFTLVNTWSNLTAPNLQFCGQFTATAGTGGTTINYTDPTTGKTPPTFAQGILGTLAPSYNVGFVDCVVRNINDLGVVFYGGVTKGYIRNCDISGCGGGAMVFADTANRGPNYDCEISNCELWNNNGAGAAITSNIFGIEHFNTTIEDNHVFGNHGSGIAVSYADGALIGGNYVHNNISGTPALTSYTGEIVVSSAAGSATRVSVVGNVVRDPCNGWVPTSGPAYGIAINNADYCYIADNRIGDYQTAPTMTAAIGGTWGKNGLSEGNYYGPRIASNDLFPADQSFYVGGSRQGTSYDMVTGFTTDQTPEQPVTPFVAGTTPTVAITGAVPGKGLTIGWNDALAPGTNRPGLGEVDFYVGGGLGAAAGFNFFQVVAASIVSGTYNSTTGAAVLTMNMPHTLMPGNWFELQAVSGTAVGVGFDWLFLNGVWVATAATNGAPVAAAGNSYATGTGVVTLTTTAPHGIIAGTSFALNGVTGTAPTGAFVANLNGTWTATSVTGTTITFTTLPGLGALTITGGQVSGSMLAFTAPIGLDILTLAGGNLFVAGGSGPLGAVRTSAGIGGSLLANDGWGNTRLGGALVHGALQAPTVANGGTYTILPNTSFVAIRNSASLASATIVLPDPMSIPGGGEAYPVPAVGGGNELEINFQNPVGALTVVAGGTLTVSGAPTSIAAAGTSINFLQHGNAWLRRIMS